MRLKPLWFEDITGDNRHYPFSKFINRMLIDLSILMGNPIVDSPVAAIIINTAIINLIKLFSHKYTNSKKLREALFY